MKPTLSRRSFIRSATALFIVPKLMQTGSVQTVRGSLPVLQMGTTLVHEHFLVDFIGADKISPNRWKRDEVVQKVLPYLLEVKKLGVHTILDCTPAYLGRDVLLQKELSEKSGLHILTNTGYYGAVGNKYLPTWAFTETAEQLAKRWIDEWENGIEATDVRPGFIKISVEGEQLSDLHQKLVKAAGITHLKTGLTICSHTGKAPLAFAQIELLQKMGVDPSAFVWTHAQAEKDLSLHKKAAQSGAWVSLDGIGWGDFENYAQAIENLKSAGLLNKVLISHDAGWYKPGEKDGGSFTGFTNIFTELIPLLKEKGFSEDEVKQLLVRNPAEAFAVRIKIR